MILARRAEVSSALLVIAAVLALLPASQLAVETVNYWVTRLMPPRILPKMSFGKEGIPGAFRTLVVVPVLLANERAVHEEVEKLEIRYLANPDSNIVFGLFSDFPDALQEHKDGDATMLRLAVEGIEALNSRYGADRFYLFHRDREWCKSEGKYIGWERKRGKLEDLNRLLCGEPPRHGLKIVHVGDPDPLANVRFVITLDSDTQLPHGTARRLIETLSHPLNRPWLAQDGSTVGGGYTIIQPRVSTALPSATASPFSRLFTDPVGSDPYTRAVSDVYQDLAGEGSYQGKAIYDPRAFYRSLAGRFPEQLLLSHDLIEGAHVRVGLASDIELYDDFPADYLSFAAREHRWIRGDWQIVDWILPRVPGADGKRIRNPLTILNRWKIFDNLRRSLVHAAALAFLLVAWITSPVFAAAASGLVGLTVFFQPDPTRRPSHGATCGMTRCARWSIQLYSHTGRESPCMRFRASAIGDGSVGGSCWSGPRLRWPNGRPLEGCRVSSWRWGRSVCSPWRPGLGCGGSNPPVYRRRRHSCRSGSSARWSRGG
jgi:cyclic beta-1,2-glucan synthetase